MTATLHHASHPDQRPVWSASGQLYREPEELILRDITPSVLFEQAGAPAGQDGGRE